MKHDKDTERLRYLINRRTALREQLEEIERQIADLTPSSLTVPSWSNPETD